MSTPAQLREPLMAAAGMLGAIVLSLFAATRVAGEYRYDTAAQRFLAEPRRSRVLVARILTYGGLAAVLAVIVTVVGMAVAEPILSGKDLTLDWTFSDRLLATGEIVLPVVAFTLGGVAAGFITRSQSTAVVVIFGLFFAEKLFGSMIGKAGSYLPYELSNNLLGFSHDVSRGTAAVVLTVIAGGVLTVAAALLKRRDVH